MSEYQRIFNKLAGLQNNVPEYRLFTQKYDPSNPEVTIPLSGAQDMLIDDSGSAFTRPGYTSVDDAVWHSLFRDKTDALGVRGQDLVVLHGVSWRTVDTGITERVSYAQAETDIYYMAGHKHGFIRDGVRHEWPGKAELPYETDRSFVNVFPAKLVGYWLSRLWLASENYVVFSEPYAFGMFDLHQNTIPFTDEITMLRPVSNGVFISTTKKVYFLSGNEPKEFHLDVASDSPALAWADSKTLIPAQIMGLDPNLGDVALWAAENGLYMGLPDGTAVNMTETVIEFPRGSGHGACQPFREHLFFCTDKQ